MRGDNVSALTLLMKMRPPSPTIAIVARELALKLVDLSFPPDAEHTPGVSHKLADLLSRAHSPTGTGVIDNNLHPALANAQISTAPVRGENWYKA